MQIEMLQPRNRLFDARLVPNGNPPHHEISVLEMLKPFGAALIETFMDRPVDEALERRDAFPHCQVDGDARVGIRPCGGRVSAFIDVAPYEARRSFSQTIYQREIVGEIGHARILDLVSNAADVQLRKMMICGWFQGSHSVADKRDAFAPLI